jgi:two-component system nitrate/nitrite response regulator NarL
MRPVSLIIVDDHPVVLQGLIALLGAHKGFKLIAACSGGAECIRAILKSPPDVALVDMNMPHPNGLQVLEAVIAQKLSTRVVFLAASPNDREIAAAVAGGVFGMMRKESAPETLINCLQAVAAGRRWLPAELVDGALERTRELRARFASVDGALTPREREVMLLVADGLSNKDVGQRLSVSEGTVKAHLHSIYQKVDVQNRTALAKFAGLYRDRMRELGDKS